MTFNRRKCITNNIKKGEEKKTFEIIKPIEWRNVCSFPVCLFFIVIVLFCLQNREIVLSIGPV